MAAEPPACWPACLVRIIVFNINQNAANVWLGNSDSNQKSTLAILNVPIKDEQFTKD